MMSSTVGARTWRRLVPAATLALSILAAADAGAGTAGPCGPADLIYFGRGTELWARDVRTGQKSRLVSGNVLDFSVSCDGVIFYIEESPDQAEPRQTMHLRWPDGRVQSVIEPGGRAPDPPLRQLISPDATKVVFSSGWLHGGIVGAMLAAPLRYGTAPTWWPVAVAPFPAEVQARLPGMTFDRFQDDLFAWSPDSRRLAFRRCSGDVDKPACLTFFADVGGPRPWDAPATPVAVQESLADTPLIPRSLPVGFAGQNLIVWTSNLYAYRVATGDVRRIVTDAWAPVLSPDRTRVAYVNSYRTGTPNVWVLDVRTSATRRLTGYPDPPDHSIAIEAWTGDSGRILFRYRGRLWSVAPDGSRLHAVGGDDRAGPEWPVMRRR